MANLTAEQQPIVDPTLLDRQTLEATKSFLKAGDLEQARKLFDGTVWSGAGVKKYAREELWEIAIESKLTMEVKQWMTKQMPLHEVVNKAQLDNVFFRQLAKYNHDLIEQLSQQISVKYAWSALQGSLGQTACTGEQAIQTWNRLFQMVRGEKQQNKVRIADLFRTRANLIYRASKADNYVGINWVLRQTGNGFDRYSSWQVLGKGLTESVTREQIDETKFAKIVNHLEDQNIDWQILEELVGWQHIHLAKIEWEKARLQVNIPENEIAKTGRVHL